MADYGLYRNGEGYSDPTAANAIKGMTYPGEIYEYKGREVLIIQNQGGYSNILTLSTAPGKDKTIIEVAGRYTTPGKLNYAFNDRLGALVERITVGEFEEVVGEIKASLKFSICAESSVEIVKESYEQMVQADRIRLLESENKGLKKKLAFVRGMYDDLMNKFIDRFGGCEDHG